MTGLGLKACELTSTNSAGTYGRQVQLYAAHMDVADKPEACLQV